MQDYLLKQPVQAFEVLHQHQMPDLNMHLSGADDSVIVGPRFLGPPGAWSAVGGYVHWKSKFPIPEWMSKSDFEAKYRPMAQLGFIDGVLKFNRAAGRTEYRFDPRAVALHIGLQLEELAEKLEAIGLDAGRMQYIGNMFKKGLFDDAVKRADRTVLLDADVDLMVVTIGAMMSSGADIYGACHEVNRSNLAKIGPDGVVIKDANGKILKPPGWTPPDLEPFTARTT